MTYYKAPVNEMCFLLQSVFNAPQMWKNLAVFADSIDMVTARSILDETDKIARELIQPINRNGDEQGVVFEHNKVITPAGYRTAYQQYAQDGWVGLCGDPEFGGMGMPKMLGVLVDEMSYSASNAFTLYVALTAGAALCINVHGNCLLKSKYLPKLYSGQWTGSMDMTEPQAGSDLRHINTRSRVQPDNSYLISGSKIFITAGDHDLTENIIHLVLAKVTDSNRVSLFVVPKFAVDDAGQLGDTNGVTVSSIEHKMGLNGSATCVVNFDNARGELVGQLDRGLECMFTMMNYERLSIGVQGLGNAQFGYQMAAGYAKERAQGVANVSSGGSQDPILVHGDIRRQLLTIRCYTEAGRALAVYTAQQLDLAKHAKGEEQQKAAGYIGLLTPITKAFLTDRGFEATVMAQQIFGGYGYIRETGIEQLVRDGRIAQIYEGTNGIQAIDFLGRKVTGDNVRLLTEFVNEHLTIITPLEHTDEQHKNKLIKRFKSLLEVAHKINDLKNDSPSVINATAVDFLDAFGHLMYGYLWLRMADAAVNYQDRTFALQKRQLADFYLAKLLPKVDYHLAQTLAGDTTVMAMSPTAF